MNPYQCYLHTWYSLFPQNITNKKTINKIKKELKEKTFKIKVIIR